MVRYLISALAVVLIFRSSSQMSVLDGEGKSCTFAGKERRIGSSWHPTLQPFGVMNCINCTCMLTGEVTCHSQPQCPAVTCRNPVIREGECCPSCEHDTRKSGKKSHKSSKLRHKQCRHGGAPYQHGQVFPTSKTALRPTRENQCVLCICLDGEIMCHLKSCQNLTCAKTVYVDDDCCPVCEDTDKQGQTWPEYGDTFDFLNGGESSAEGKDCRTVTGLHQNGTSWTPVVGPFGKMNCVTCTCKSGTIQCDKIQCKSPSSCKRLKSVAGRCCPICRKRGKQKSKKRKKPSSQKSSGSRKKQSRIDDTKHSNRKELLSVPCVPKKTDTMVRMADIDGTLTFLFENLKSGKIEKFTWTVRKGRVKQARIQSVSTAALSELLGTQVDTYRILGATKQRRLQKFKNRLKRLEQRCKDKCRKNAVLKLRKHLKLKKISFKSRCT